MRVVNTLSPRISQYHELITKSVGKMKGILSSGVWLAIGVKWLYIKSLSDFVAMCSIQSAIENAEDFLK